MGGRHCGGFQPEGEMMKEGWDFTQRLYGNQQVPLADEKKRGLSYEREKQGPTPLFILLTLPFPLHPSVFFFPVAVVAPTPVAATAAQKKQQQPKTKKYEGGEG